MYMRKSILVSLLICLISNTAVSQEISHIEVMALFKNKAMVSIDDEQHLLKVGEVAIAGCEINQSE